MGLPVYGPCERCGRGGLDDDTGAANSGFVLKKYDGMDLCDLCINQLKDREHDEAVREQIRDDEKLRSSLGFTR